tara:strand:- start:1179 stop:2222 length:1044 start_codon:yes stop_codon:yes gene_type:complete
MLRHCKLFFSFSLIIYLLTSPAQAFDAENYFKGKRITIVLGYGAGGTYGKTSLLLTEFLGKNIPGNPTLIKQHMPGAGGLKAANYAANAMPKNGLFLLMPPDMMVVSQILRPKKVKFNSSNFTWLGRVFGSNNLLVVRRDSGVNNFEDTKTKMVILGGTGKGSPTYIVPGLAKGLLGAKFKQVQGYKGSAGSRKAMEQGEVQGVALAWAAWKNGHPQWFKGGNKSFAVGILQSGFKRDKDLPNIPLIRELVTTPEQKAAADLIATNSLLGRGLALPPGAPTEVVGVLRKAFWKTVNDPVFVKEAKRRRLPHLPMNGANMQKTINKLLSDMSPEAIKTARNAIFPQKK